jgi:xylan 1,4-beta-xylosidase
MKIIPRAVLLIAAIALAGAGLVPSHAQHKNHFYNPVLAGSAPSHAQHKNNFYNPVLAGFYPDPSVCRVGGDFYLVNSSFAYFPGIPIFHSTDLAHWEQIGHVMDRPEQLNLDGAGVSRGLFAPAIRYHDGIFYVVCTLVDKGGNFVVTATNPRGPWSNPVFLPAVNGIDPSPFFDENGKAYIVYNSIPPNDSSLYDGHRTIRIIEFDALKLATVGKDSILVNGGTDIAKKPVWIEGPHIFHKDGYYYLIAAEGGTADQHSEVVFRSRSLMGPYISYEKNPILTQRHLDASRKDPITSTGHADFVQLPNGEWWTVFLGVRPYQIAGGEYYNTGRETFLAPVSWTDGWPTIVPGKEEVNYSYPLPLITRDAAKPFQFSGNLHFRDEFAEKTLPFQWEFLRTPREQWYDLTTHRGSLTLKLRSETCAGNGQPSFVAYRQQHLNGSATTNLKFSPAAENEKAGIAVFHNEDHFYYLCKSVNGGAPVIQLFKSSTAAASRTMELLASHPLPPNGAAGPLGLKIEARGATYAFFYSTTSTSSTSAGSHTRWTLLKDSVDAKFVSTRAAGGFVGCLYALYATSLGTPSGTIASYSWFDYRGSDTLYKQQ